MKKYNVGIALLKLWMIIEVVTFHSWTTEDPVSGFAFFVFDARLYAVPVFFTVAAYFSGKKVMAGEGLVSRIKRLLIPYVFWSVFIWIALSITDIIIGSDYIHGIGNLIVELLTGSADYNVSLWFITDLLIITIVYTLIGRLIKTDGIKVFVYVFLGALGIALQYANVLVYLLENKGDAINYMVGRIPEMLPFMSIGVLFAYFDVLNRLKKHWIITAIVSVAVFVINYNFTFLPLVRHFWYGGIRTMLLAVSLVVLFYVLPLDNIGKKATKAVSLLTGCVMGVFYIHYPIGEIIKDYIIPADFARNHVYIVIAIVFGVSYIISFLLSIIPNAHVKRLVS